MKRAFFWTLSGFLFPLLALGQQHTLNNNIPILDFSGQGYPHAWAGGNNMPQYSATDLNLDGKKDLVVYNRDGRSFSTYINTGSPGQVRYRYDPRYQANFDSCHSCVDFAMLVDYNCDGREDVICGRTTGTNFQVWEQIIYDGDSVGFELRYDPVLSYNPLSGITSFMSQVRTDIPAFMDVDYDGDLDVISSQIGRTTWAWYRNYAMERHGRCDTLDMELEQDCWGHFRENDLDNELLLADTFLCPVVRDGRTPPESGNTRHVGDALLVFDSNGDSLPDMLIGDVSYPTAALAINQGTLDDALMTQAIYEYPTADSAIRIHLMPAFYHLDVDNDDIRDLIVAPNYQALFESVNGTALYLNSGSDNQVDFRFQGRNFIAAEQVDMGRASVPLLFDYNQDGLQDLLVAGERAIWADVDSAVTEEQFATLRLYRNIGTPQTPSYRLIDSNYLDLANVIPPIGRPSPTLADLDGDGDQDLFIGTATGKIRHYTNVAASGTTANFVVASPDELVDELGEEIGQDFSYAAPSFYDFDGDGDLDLFSGNRFGYLVYYENVGTSTQPSFRFITDRFGDIRVNVNPSNPIDITSSAFSRPVFIDHDLDGDASLVVGSTWGYLELFEDISQGLTDTLFRDELLFGQSFGRLVMPSAAVIDSSNELTWIMGTTRGGLLLLNTAPFDTSATVGIAQDPSPPTALAPSGFRWYPNPVQESLTLEFPSETEQTPFSLRLINLMGQELSQTTGQGSRYQWNLSQISPGIYLMQIDYQGRRWTEKVLIE